jgi:hypothetical protein
MAIERQLHSAGLCITCNNSPGCGFRRIRGFDAIFCETFDGDGASPQMDLRRRIQTPPTAANVPATEEPATVRLAGLCVNCEHRDECTFPKPEGGVWHCEEYR